jgi:D-serine deaminase-like pyridoxal phosphate-dependent protein
LKSDTVKTTLVYMAPLTSAKTWFEVSDEGAIPSPALLIYLERVQENLQQMLAIVGSPDRLRPHIKTHKMQEPLEMQLALGIRKFKCATLAEAELAAKSAVPDLLLAYQLVGPAISRFLDLIEAFPETEFSVICDDPEVIGELSKAVFSRRPARSDAAGQNHRLEVLLDIDLGQQRTGVKVGAHAAELYHLIVSSPGLAAGGLHAYDGHIGDTDLTKRTAVCDAAFAPVAAFRCELMDAGLPVPRLVVGGSPTFPIHARRPDVECSPGTCVFWDAGYATKLPDLPFKPAALLLTRVISKPGPNRLCLDLGHKAVGSEMPHPRVVLLNLEDAQFVTHSEEHLVIETSRSNEYRVGDCLYGIPWHICPTVALHSSVVLVKRGEVVGTWKVAARGRCLASE